MCSSCLSWGWKPLFLPLPHRAHPHRADVGVCVLQADRHLPAVRLARDEHGPPDRVQPHFNWIILCELCYGCCTSFSTSLEPLLTISGHGSPFLQHCNPRHSRQAVSFLRLLHAAGSQLRHLSWGSTTRAQKSSDLRQKAFPIVSKPNPQNRGARQTLNLVLTGLLLMVAQGSRWLCSGHTFADCHELEALMVMIMIVVMLVMMMATAIHATSIRASTRLFKGGHCTAEVILVFIDGPSARTARKAKDQRYPQATPTP